MTPVIPKFTGGNHEITRIIFTTSLEPIVLRETETHSQKREARVDIIRIIIIMKIIIRREVSIFSPLAQAYLSFILHENLDFSCCGASMRKGNKLQNVLLFLLLWRDVHAVSCHVAISKNIQLS